MNFNNENANLESTKKREYFKQQQLLRTMTKTSSAISADDMIENLLSKKEIFQKRKDLNGQTSKQGQTQNTQWPSWLTVGKEPPLYKKIWVHVGMSNGLADTTKTSSLLLTSRLTTDTLGYIWSLTNLTVPGSLTQQELYISLALVALAQNGYTFTNASVVKQLLEAPLPRLDLSPGDPPINLCAPPQPVPTPSSSSPSTSLIVNHQQPSVPTVTETLSLLDISSEPVSLLESSPTKTLSILSASDLNNDFVCNSSAPVPEESLIFTDFQANDDDFDDFKSADTFMADMNNLTVLDVKDTCLNKEMNLNLEPIRKELPPPPLPPPLLDLDDFVVSDFKEPPVNQLQDKTFVHEEVKSIENLEKTYVEDLFPKCVSPPPHVPSEDIFENISTPPESSSIATTSSTITSTASTKPPSVPSSANEDKYSALRVLDSSFQNEQPEVDEFGDFLTADPLTETPPTPGLVQSEQTDIQLKCLEACIQLLKDAVKLFESIENPKVLDEVTSDERGRNYLEEIVEVERIGRRIRSNRERSDLITEFESLSQALQPYIEPVKNNHMEDQEGPKCGLCLMDIGPAHVKYGINHFHAPCANLYLQRVDPILPIAPVM